MYMGIDAVGVDMATVTDHNMWASLYFIAWVFLGEMVLKLLALGPRKYRSTNWNRFDGTIVTVSMVELIWKKASGGELPLDPTVIRLFRIFRATTIIFRA